MSELQMGLLALGGVAVLGVFGYNKWQERQHRKVAERVFQQPGEDVLLERQTQQPAWEAEGDSATARREPVLNPVSSEADEWARHEAEQAAAASLSAVQQPDAATDPAGEGRAAPLPWEDGPSSPATAAAATTSAAFVSEDGGGLSQAAMQEAALPAGQEADQETGRQPGKDMAQERGSPGMPAEVAMPVTLLSPGVDAIAVLELVEWVPASQIMASQREALRRLKKPLHWVGFNEARGEWEFMEVHGSEAYRRLRVGLQLADRQGPVSGGDFSLFAGAMQQLADELMAVVTMPSSQQALDQAQQLDRFCADVDMQIGVNLVSRGLPFQGTKIRALAESAGMVLGSEGCYNRLDDEGKVLFSLQNFETSGFAAETLKSMSTHGLVFLLDVPRTPRGQQVYSQMVDIAKRFADALNGALVDDNRQALAEPQLAHIRQEYVVKPQAAMEAQGIPAGGPLALRLFS